MILKQDITFKKAKISRNQLCPCESGRKYKNCCLDKKLEWGINSNGKYEKIQIIDNEIAVEELTRVFDMQKERFKKVFGREMEDEEKIFFDQDSYSIESRFNNVVKYMEKCDIDPAIIYATNKTKMFVSEFNKDIMTGKQIKEWNEAIDEYYDTINQSENEESLIDMIFTEIESIVILYGTILSYSGELENPIKELSSYKYYEVIFFNITKSVKTLKSIRHNLLSELIEDALNLIRSLYENYLHLIYCINEPEKIEELLKAKLGVKKGTHIIKKINKNRFIVSKDKNSNTSVKEYITTYEKAKSSKHKEDLIIFNYVYSFLSGFTHPDIDNIKHYTSESKFNATIKCESDTAIFFAVYIGTLILSETLILDSLSETCKKDIVRVSNRIIDYLKEYLRTRDLEIGDERLKINLINRIDNIKSK